MKGSVQTYITLKNEGPGGKGTRSSDPENTQGKPFSIPSTVVLEVPIYIQYIDPIETIV